MSVLSAFCILMYSVPICEIPVSAAVSPVWQETKGTDAGETETAENSDNSKTEAAEPGLTLTAPSAVLIEGSTGSIIYEKDKDKERMIASVTKIMTMLLIFEALDSGRISLEDSVTVSAHAASMGGSQVYLEENEVQSVETMIKCICISSANDAATAMAEYIGGTEEAFVEKMNERAKELGMEHTHFLNCCGLDDDITTGHYSSAYDVALMSRELIVKHPQIKQYSTVWMDSFTHHTRKGEKEFGLTNTNRLVRTYDGITGLKTGSTSKAKYCLSATANRGGIDMIAVVLGAATPADRFSEAASLLNYGYANTQVYKDLASEHTLEPAKVGKGKKDTVKTVMEKDFSYVFTGGEDISSVTGNAVYDKKIEAPVKKGDVVGTVEYTYGGKTIGSVALLSREDVERAGFFHCLLRMIQWYAGVETPVKEAEE